MGKIKFEYISYFKCSLVSFLKKKGYSDKNIYYLIYNSIKNCFNSRLKIEKIEDINYWKKKLGTLFSNTTDKIAKANSTLISFERGLDLLNKELLRLPEDDKKDIYSIIRYMIS